MSVSAADLELLRKYDTPTVCNVVELFDVQADFDEMTNLAQQETHRASVLRETMAEVLNKTGPGVYRWCMEDK